MSEEHDSKISGLYQKSSQETPTAHIDRAVLSMARKSVRRRAYSPFGNHWVVGGAVVGVVTLSVLLILAVPPQPDTYAPAYDVVVPSSTEQSEMQKESEQRKRFLSEADNITSELWKKRAQMRQVAPSKPRFDFYPLLPEMEVVVPEEEIQAELQQQPVDDQSARAVSTLPAAAIYLQIGAFREQTHADALKRELVGLGFRCEIQKISIDNANVYHRVRVGPFTDYVALDKSRKKLREMGFETRVVKKQE